MLKDLETVLAAAAIATATLVAPACDGGDDGESESATETDAGCPGTESTAGCPGSDSDAGCPGTTAGCPGSALPPTNADDLKTWLEAESYSGWPAESAPHDSAGPHGRVQVYINNVLDTAMMNGDDPLPMDSAAVKVLFDDADTRIGWSVMVKTQADSDMGNGWYWYQLKNDAVDADGNGEGGCTGCHSASGVDYFTTPYPLQ